MIKYTLGTNNRPCQFTGELLGSTAGTCYPHPPNLKNKEEVADWANKQEEDPDMHCCPFGKFTQLDLYRTKSGKFVLEVSRASWDFRHTSSIICKEEPVSTYESIEQLIKDQEKEDGTVGRVTCDLMNKVISKHPDLSDAWIQQID